MALVKCWECGKDVSDSASSCPHCGAAQSGRTAPAAMHATAVGKKKAGGSWWKWLIGVPVALFAAFMIFGMMQPANPEKRQARAVYELCQADLDKAVRLNNGTAGFISGTCDKLRSDFIAKYGVNP